MSGFWRVAFRVQYRLLALSDPIIRRVWRRFGIGNVVELTVDRRDGGGTRSRLVGLLRADAREYLGHPNGHVGWTRDLVAAGGATLRWHTGPPWPVRAEELPGGDERESAIRATGQHPFPGNVIYRLGRRRVREAGVFFRLSRVERSVEGSGEAG
ncbi:MAG TPA: hypothetical protein VNW68_06905 [Candidatus Limnocylindria bacterium]|jgi:hypothetical protein|nr:hypothetical protein [Candidatus Limnocylindria bacterium]